MDENLDQFDIDVHLSMNTNGSSCEPSQHNDFSAGPLKALLRKQAYAVRAWKRQTYVDLRRENGLKACSNMIAKSTDDSYFSCKYCCCKFVSRDVVRTHVKLIHRGENCRRIFPDGEVMCVYNRLDDASSLAKLRLVLQRRDRQLYKRRTVLSSKDDSTIAGTSEPQKFSSLSPDLLRRKQSASNEQTVSTCDSTINRNHPSLPASLLVKSPAHMLTVPANEITIATSHNRRDRMYNPGQRSKVGSARKLSHSTFPQHKFGLETPAVNYDFNSLCKKAANIPTTSAPSVSACTVFAKKLANERLSSPATVRPNRFILPNRCPNSSSCSAASPGVTEQTNIAISSPLISLTVRDSQPDRLKDNCESSIRRVVNILRRAKAMVSGPISKTTERISDWPEKVENAIACSKTTENASTCQKMVENTISSPKIIENTSSRRKTTENTSGCPKIMIQETHPGAASSTQQALQSRNLISYKNSTRFILPGYNNGICSSAPVSVSLHQFGQMRPKCFEPFLLIPHESVNRTQPVSVANTAVPRHDYTNISGNPKPNCQLFTTPNLSMDRPGGNVECFTID